MALRQQVWVDRSVQGVLVGRVVLYWVAAILYIGIGSACFQYNQNPDWTLTKHFQVLFQQVWPWLPTTIMVLPLVIYDVVRLSNLFAGPVYRLRKHFENLRQDIACSPLFFREDDYWRDLAAPINDMQAEILRLRAGVIELQQVASQTSALMANFKNGNTNESDNIDSTSVDTTPAEQSIATPQPTATEATQAPLASGEATESAEPNEQKAPELDDQTDPQVKLAPLTANTNVLSSDTANIPTPTT